MFKLFLIFLKIGAFSFGGGYGMIAMVKEECLLNNWLTEDEILEFIGICESTPGPIAVNMATFVGYSQYGFIGSLLATFGVILPAFLIILLIVSILNKLLENKYVSTFFNCIKPAVVGLIIGTAILLFLSIIFSITRIDSSFDFDYQSLIIFSIITLIFLGIKFFFKKKIHPILLIIIGGILGILFNL